MRKVLVFILVIGFLLGTFVVMEEMGEEYSFDQLQNYSENTQGGGIGDPAPCGGGESGGGGGTPG